MRRPLGRVAGGDAGVVAEGRVARAEPQRPACPAQAGLAARPARVSAQPSASAERTLGARAQARRASATARPRSPWSAARSRELDVGVRRRPSASSRSLRVAPARDRAGPRRDGRPPARPRRARSRTRAAAAASTTVVQPAIAPARSPRGGGQARPAGERGDVAGHRGERRARMRAGPRRAGRGRARGRPAASARRRAFSRAPPPAETARAIASDRAGEVAVQLAEVGHAGVGGQRGLAVDAAAGACARPRRSGRARRARRPGSGTRRARRARARGRARRAAARRAKSCRPAASVAGLDQLGRSPRGRARGARLSTPSART